MCGVIVTSVFGLSVHTSHAQESTLQIAETIKGKSTPTGVHPGVVAFHAPDGNGRRGANGLYVPPGKFSPGGITEMTFTHQRGGHARGVQIIHPLNDGHVVVTILKDQINVVPGGSWPGHFGRKSSPTEVTDAFAELFPLEEEQVISVRTRVFPNGVTEVAVDGKVMETTVVEKVSPFTLTEGFKLMGEAGADAVSLPTTWPAGSAGIILGPLDKGMNIAQKVVFRRLDPSSVPLPKVALKTESDPKPTSPLPSTPQPMPATAVSAAKITLDTPPKRVISVWGLHDEKGTRRTLLFSDGTTNQDYGWKPVSRTKIELSEGFGDLVDGGSTLLGRWKGGAIIDGRLLMSNCWVAGTTDAVDDVQAISELDSTDRAFHENLIGIWQLTAINRRKQMNFSLPVQISADHRVIEAGRTIATWKSERTQVDMHFLDTSIGEATVSPRNKDELSGRAKSDANDLWTVQLARVKALSTWDTDRLGTVVLYSNGRVSDPTGVDGHGFWWKEGLIFRFSCYTINFAADQRSFTGTDRYRTGIKGTLLAGPEN